MHGSPPGCWRPRPSSSPDLALQVTRATEATTISTAAVRRPIVGGTLLSALLRPFQAVISGPDPTIAAPPPVAHRREGVALAAFLSFTVAALLGYGTFGVHPGLLERIPWAAGFYATAFPWFARLHIVVAAVVLVLVLAGRVRGRWIVPGLAAALVGLGAEVLGTGTGVPFGQYRYSAMLGFRLFEDVPVLVPVSWFLMGLASYTLAAVRRGGSLRGFGARVVGGAMGLVIWDLALDPAMSHLAPYWIWETTGPYYGMPWVNLLGWFVTGLGIMVAFELLNVRAWLLLLPRVWMTRYWGVSVLMPAGMMAAAGLWPGVLVSVGAAAGYVFWADRMSSADRAVTAPPQYMGASRKSAGSSLG